MIKKKSPFKIILTIIVAIIVICGIMVVVDSMSYKSDDMQGSDLNSEQIDYVRELSPDGANGITFGEAYEDFFSDPEWGFFREEKHEEPVVEFSGGCTYKDKEGTAYLQFILDATGKIKRYYGQFKYEGSEEREDMDDETLMALFVDPIIDYAENHQEKPLSDKKINKLYSMFD